jgi:ATP phosphoribosyltransferase regulatory subunit
MTEYERNALLPAGLRDVLPHDAAFEAAIVEKLVAVFEARGYDRVKPPLIEFEDSLLAGAGVAVASQTFRLMDPVSQRMMGVRADITPQIARIAKSRLAGSPRPLRLSYAGDVLRVRGSQLCPERQIVQVGAELIGSGVPASDAEIITMAASAIEAVGVTGLSIDLTVPRLVPSLFDRHGVDGATAAMIREALDRKDPGGVSATAGEAATMLIDLLSATGPVDDALAKMAAIDLPDVAASERDRVAEVVSLVRATSPDVVLTLDPVENRGFEYHTGIGFTIFAAGHSGELASGGRYRARDIADVKAEGERATGVTLYVDAILALVARGEVRRRIFLPYNTQSSTAAALRDEGWVTVMALESHEDDRAQAGAIGCSHLLGNAGPEPVKEGSTS